MARFSKYYYETYEWRHTCEFGVPSSKYNENTGANIPVFKSLKRVHFAKKKQTMTEKIQVAGTDYENSIVIIVRHQRDLEDVKPLYVKIGDKKYLVINYSADDTSYDSLDFVTIKRVEKTAG